MQEADRSSPPPTEADRSSPPPCVAVRRVGRLCLWLDEAARREVGADGEAFSRLFEATAARHAERLQGQRCCPILLHGRDGHWQFGQA
eukprot:7387277-Prymnesium_polylepis.1